MEKLLILGLGRENTSLEHLVISDSKKERKKGRKEERKEEKGRKMEGERE